MTDKTKQIFAAPWKTMPEDPGIVQDVNGAAVAKCVSPAVANAFSRLPELYDALVEAAYEFCHNCVSLTGDSEYVPDSDEFIEKGCPKKIGSCFCEKWWELLRNVREGK